MLVHLCGVRGSLPATGPEFARVGGETSCVAIAREGEPPRLVLDAGTGLRRLSAVLAGAPFRGTLLLGHLHWDHVMGIPFFRAGDHPEAVVHLRLPEQGADAEALLSRMMSPPLFPITPQGLRGRWRFDTYDEGRFEAEGFEVLAREIPHPGGRTMGLRVSDGRSSIAYLSDHAPHQLGPGDRGVGVVHPAALELARGVDLLLHDAQYTRAELVDKAGWGHAAADYALELAERAGVGRLALTHHDPSRADDELEAMVATLARRAPVPVQIAVEGAVIPL